MGHAPIQLTTELAEIIAEAYEREKDPLTIIVSHAYFFCNLNISKLRTMLIISDEFGTLRTPSKELIRRMISSMKETIITVAKERYGDNAFDLLLCFVDENVPTRYSAQSNAVCAILDESCDQTDTGQEK